MPVAVAESRRQAMARAVAGGGYDWAAGADLAWTPDAEDAAEIGRRMVLRYRTWAAANPMTQTPGKYESAFRRYKDMQFETVNPVDDTIVLPEPHFDARLQKWVSPKNVFDKNVLSRRRFLYEIDGMSLDDQRKLLEPLLRRGVIQRVVFSGCKSLHCIVEEEDEPDASLDDEMYKYAWRYMAFRFFHDLRFQNLRLPMRIDGRCPEVVDNRCGHPSRTTRSPFAVRKDEKTGWKPVEQKLLYFQNVRVFSGWRGAYERAKADEADEIERARRRAQAAAFRCRDRGRKTPNEAARRFIGGDQSDGWKHASLPSAVGSLVACGYGRDEVAGIFRQYKKELQTFAMNAYDYFERRDRR